MKAADFPQQNRREVAAVVVALEARDGSKQHGDEMTFRCIYPDKHRNDDAKPSASFNVSKGVWLCRACGASGHSGDLLDRLGDVPSGSARHARVVPLRSRRPVPTIEVACDCGRSHKRPERGPDNLGSPTGWWFYHDANGDPRAVVCRWDTPKEKEILPFNLLIGEWRSLPTPQPLYRLDDLAQRPDDPVVIVEGEKCAAAVAGLGWLARTQLDAVVARFVLRRWRMPIDDGDRPCLTLPKQLVDLGRRLRLSRLGEVRTFPREYLLSEIRGDA